MFGDVTARRRPPGQHRGLARLAKLRPFSQGTSPFSRLSTYAILLSSCTVIAEMVTAPLFFSSLYMKVKLALQGACGSCPSSTTTMKMGIERVLNENFLNIGGVRDLD